MSGKRILVACLSVAAGLAVMMTAGCSKKLADKLVPNIPPTVRLTAAPYDTSRATLNFYYYKMDWIGDDPDGRVDYYLYAVDPPLDPTQKINWVKTTDKEEIIPFTADSSNKDTGLATHPHIFSLCCVDDRGDTSQVVSRGFFSYTQCPSVKITNPVPNGLLPAFVTPSVYITWSGDDPDGVVHRKPVSYKYMLFGLGSRYPEDQAKANYATIGEYYAYDYAKHGLSQPWEGWIPVSGDTTAVRITDLVPGQEYLFVLVGFDESGAFSPIFNLSTNVLILRPGYAVSLGPIITMFNESFTYTYPSGGWVNSEQTTVPLEVAAGQPITINWTAVSPTQGAQVNGYRWMSGPAGSVDPTDETARANIHDIGHWSDLSLNTTSVTLGPFNGGDLIDFFVEARDNNGLRSLGHVRMTVVQASLDKPLLIVNDTRLQAEKVLATGCLDKPVLTWPNAAELDTFLFARGGVPWQCYTPVLNSDPGLFSGYDFQVLRTKTSATDKSVRLATLGQYKNVVWITDPNVSGVVNTSPNAYALRFMCQPGRVNTLAAYSRQGGKVWLCGGGAAYAACNDLYNKSTNDFPAWTYSSTLPTELVSGRMMFDIAHWQSELQVANVVNYPMLKRSTRAEYIAAHPWTMLSFGLAPLSSPNYMDLPAQLEAKTTATDPVPATRASTPTTFYRSSVTYRFEYLHSQNFIVEDVDPRPDVDIEASTLDTLMRTEAPLTILGYQAFEKGGKNPDGTLKPGTIVGTPLMTYYHGQSFPAFVFSGFDIWNYQRPELVQLVDFVLQQIFGLSKSAGPSLAPARSHTAPRAWVAPGGTTGTASAVRAGSAASSVRKQGSSE